jgi:hypothetical protein
VDSDEDSDAYIKPAKKTKPTATAQPSMTDFEKKSAGSKAAAKPASSTTARKPSGITKPPPKKAAQGRDDEISVDELQLESAPPVAPRPDGQPPLPSQHILSSRTVIMTIDYFIIYAFES